MRKIELGNDWPHFEDFKEWITKNKPEYYVELSKDPDSYLDGEPTILGYRRHLEFEHLWQGFHSERRAARRANK